MSEEKVQTPVAEEKAPELPTSEPPVEDPKPEVIPAADDVATEPEATATTEEEAKTEEKVEEKKPSRLKKRLTLKWGKNRDQPETAAEPEPTADPRADALAWIGQQIPAAVHKVNYHVLDWAQNLAVEDESARKPIPGKDGQVTRNQFLAFLKDGDFLMKLANKLQAGAVEPAAVEEGADAAKQKEVQTKNVESFATWANETLGSEGAKAVSAADILEKGKTGYPVVFETLWNLGLKAQEKFAQQGIDVDTVVAAAGAAVRTNLIGQIMAFFRRTRSAPVEDKKEEEKVDETAAAGDSAPNAAEGEQVEDPCEKVESVTVAPAVAAN